MIDEQLENTVVTLHVNQGWSIRRIARDLMVSRSRIRRILTMNTAVRDTPKEEGVTIRLSRTSKLDPFKDDIANLIEKYPKITGQRLYEHLIEKGYTGGITICREYLRIIRGAGKKTPIKMVETGPGQLASMIGVTMCSSLPRMVNRKK